MPLGYPLGLAFDLWCAWKDHHQMAVAGGYLDQPRRWRDMLHTMNRRFNPLYEDARKAHYPDDEEGGGIRGGGRERDDDSVVHEVLGGGSPFGGGNPGMASSWEQFRGGR